MDNFNINKMKDLKKQYEKICDDYIKVFCKKQGMDFEYWIVDQVGGIVCCNDFYFNFLDIVWDINNNQPKGKIVDWYFESLDNPKKAINYTTYTKLKK